MTKWGQTPLFITFEQSCFVSISTLHKVICHKFCQVGSGSGSTFFKLLDPDPDPHWEEQLVPDPDPQKRMDPQPCEGSCILKLSLFWYCKPFVPNFVLSYILYVHTYVSLRNSNCNCPPMQILDMWVNFFYL